MQPIVKYHCPVCSAEYDTPEEAEKCFVPLHERFKQGDIIVIGSYNMPKVVSGTPYKDAFGIAAEQIPTYNIARGFGVKKGIAAKGFYVGSGLCRVRKYEVSEAEKIVKDLSKRLRAAEKFLEMVKKTYEQGVN